MGEWTLERVDHFNEDFIYSRSEAGQSAVPAQQTHVKCQFGDDCRRRNKRPHSQTEFGRFKSCAPSSFVWVALGRDDRKSGDGIRLLVFLHIWSIFATNHHNILHF